MKRNHATAAPRKINRKSLRLRPLMGKGKNP
jgi:hypothetical protein